MKSQEANLQKPNLQKSIPGPALGTPRPISKFDSKKARTVYVGGVRPDMPDFAVRDFFEDTISKVPDRPPRPGPIIDRVTVNHAKQYAFVEFSHHTDADIAICMDGAKFLGAQLRIRRPKNYQPPQAVGNVPKYNKKYTIDGIIATHVQDGPNKIFLGGLPPSMTDVQVQSMVSQFGTLKAFSLVKNFETNTSKGFAFFSYKDPRNTEHACRGLHGQVIEGRSIICKLADTKHSTPLQQPHLGMQSHMKKHSKSLQPTHSGMQNHMKRGGHQMQLTPRRHDGPVMQGIHPSRMLAPQPMISNTPPISPYASHMSGSTLGMARMMVSPSGMGHPTPKISRILKLLGVVSGEDLLNNEEYYDILLDIRQECRKFGKLLRIYVPRFSPQGWRGAVNPNVGAVFLEYRSVKGALTAQEHITGRKFNEREITIQFLPEHIWATMEKTEPALPT